MSSLLPVEYEKRETNGVRIILTSDTAEINKHMIIAGQAKREIQKPHLLYALIINFTNLKWKISTFSPKDYCAIICHVSFT